MICGGFLNEDKLAENQVGNESAVQVDGGDNEESRNYGVLGEFLKHTGPSSAAGAAAFRSFQSLMAARSRPPFVSSWNHFSKRLGFCARVAPGLASAYGGAALLRRPVFTPS